MNTKITTKVVKTYVLEVDEDMVFALMNFIGNTSENSRINSLKMSKKESDMVEGLYVALDKEVNKKK